ncbi:MAG: hypothetical protein M0P69_16045, partial [Bacteroidales bacterium]|nr:hypothetical protein [Bacteroidales bacterium]
YRPVQNWNDGKVQEFEDRQVYSARDNVKLITTKTCPKCIQAEKILNDAGVGFIKIMAEDNPELIKSLNIMQAPTVVIGNKKFEGLGTIYHYINGGRTL